MSADLVVVNTCALTSPASSKCRRRIRSVIRRNPDACVAAIGCYAQTDAETLKDLKGLDYIVGTADKLRLAEIITTPVKLPDPVIVQGPVVNDTFTIKGAGHYPWNTRANIKIQEGCDFVCSFCVVPRGRGRARSRVFVDILEEARTLAGSGHRELIVTGVNIGTYRDGGYTLADVTKALCDVEGLDRIRLSSIEPTTVEEAIVDQMAAGGKLCPYLHLPLQSGDDGVLAGMKRKYDSAQFEDFARSVIDRVPNAGLGTDVMVGFPGEDEAAFKNSVEVISRLTFANVHVFSFSARPRTAACYKKNKVPAAVITERSAIMHQVANGKKAEFYAAHKGRTLRVLFEERDSLGRFTGFSDNYVKVAVESGRDLSNNLLDVMVTGVDESGSNKSWCAVGELVDSAPA